MDNESLLFYEQKSRYNDIESILYLADHYMKSSDFDKAYTVLKKFENIKSKEGSRKLAYLYQYGKGVEKDLDVAIKHYSEAYELGDISSSYNLALIHLEKGDYANAIIYLNNGRFNDNINSIKLLADLYRTGKGVVKNVDIAIKLYLEAVELGDTSLYDQIGVTNYQNGRFIEAFNYFEKGANILDKNSLYHIAICYSKGEGTYLDMQKAIYYFELASKVGEGRSNYNLSLIYAKGMGVTADQQKAKIYLDKYENYKNSQK